MKKFRLPRKTKKRLKRQLWLYPADKDGNSQMAQPRRNQEEYDAMKNGSLRNMFDNFRSKEERKAYRAKLNKEITVPDKQLKTYVDNLIRKDLRISSYQTLIKAKNTPRAVRAYYQFVNAYHFYEKDGSYGNVCCMAIDYARDLLRGK